MARVVLIRQAQEHIQHGSLPTPSLQPVHLNMSVFPCLPNPESLLGSEIPLKTIAWILVI